MNYLGSNCISNLKDRICTQFTTPQFVKIFENIEAKALKTNSENKWLNDIVTTASSVESQIPLILLAIQPKEQFYDDAAELCRSLQVILQEKFYSPIYVKLFGSAANQSALKDSDVDVYLDFHNHPVTKGALEFLFNNLKNEHKIFQKIQLINGSIPVFKGVTFSGLHCNISFMSPFGVYRSHLINFFVVVNDRIQQLIVLLKFWLKKQDLYGEDSHKIGGYALTLLVIFCLQQGPEPVLPSIFTLQKQCDLQEIVDGWPVSFDQDPSLISVKLSLLELLKKFFAFYAGFDFGSTIVSPFVGRGISKGDFRHDQSLPSEFECLRGHLINFQDLLNGFGNTAMCVQDVFTHTFDVTKNVERKVVNDFKEACEEACNVFKEEAEKDNRKYHESVLFYTLFQPVGLVEVAEVAKSEDNSYLFQDEPSEKTMRILKIFIESKDRVNKFFTFLYNLLTRVMKCEAVIQEEDNVKIYKCKSYSRNVLCRNFRKKVMKQYKILTKKTITEVAENLSNSNEKLKLGNGDGAFDVVCAVKNNPSHVECRFICKERRGKRSLVTEHLNSLSCVLRSWTNLELSRK